MDVSEIERMVIDDRYKGILGGTDPFALSAVAKKNWNVLKEDLPLPLAVLKRSGLDNNRDWMLRYLNRHGVAFCPHGKAVMAPQLAQELLEAGAWGISVANVFQLQVYRRYGVPRVVFANQLVGRQTIRYVFDELARDPEFELFGLVDSLDGVAALAEVARERGIGRPLPLLIEAGEPGARNGLSDARGRIGDSPRCEGRRTLARPTRRRRLRGHPSGSDSGRT